MNMRFERMKRPRGLWERSRERYLLGGRVGRVVRALRQKRPQEAMREMPWFTRLVSMLMVVVFFVTGDPVHGATLVWDSDGLMLNNVMNQAGQGQGGVGR